MCINKHYFQVVRKFKMQMLMQATLWVVCVCWMSVHMGNYFWLRHMLFSDVCGTWNRLFKPALQCEGWLQLVDSFRYNMKLVTIFQYLCKFTSLRPWWGCLVNCLKGHNTFMKQQSTYSLCQCKFADVIDDSIDILRIKDLQSKQVAIIKWFVRKTCLFANVFNHCSSA